MALILHSADIRYRQDTLERCFFQADSISETLFQSALHEVAFGMRDFTAVVKHDEGWWYGWIEEVPGVNAQERSREELILALRECLSEALEMNRRDALESAEHNYTDERIAL